MNEILWHLKYICIHFKTQCSGKWKGSEMRKGESEGNFYLKIFQRYVCGFIIQALRK